MSQCRAEWDCKCQDVANNTYYCIRKIDDSENTIFCQFDDDEKFIEAYDLNEDPYQLSNIFLEENEDSMIQREYIIESLDDIRNVIQETTDNTGYSNNMFADIPIIQYMKQLFAFVIHHI